MSPIEKAARALCRVDGYDPDEEVKKPEPPQYMRKDIRARIPVIPRWQTYLNHAQAVLMAIREPSDAMLDAGFEFTADPCWKEDLAKAWRAMVDVAVEEG